MYSLNTMTTLWDAIYVSLMWWYVVEQIIFSTEPFIVTAKLVRSIIFYPKYLIRKDTGTCACLLVKITILCLFTNQCIYKRPFFHTTLTDVTLLFDLSPCSATTAGLAVSPRQRPELTPSVGARGPVSRYLRINMSLLSPAIRDHITQKKINHPPNN